MAIPKVIHYCWFGGADLPEEATRCISSWKKHCPDYEIKRWDESNYDFSQYPYAEAAYKEKKWAFVSDVARLDVVYQYGGFYLDTDVELIKSLDLLIEETAYMGFEQGRYVATGLGFGAEKQNYLIGKNLEAYRNRVFVKEDGSLDLTPCPQITTGILEKYGLIREDRMQQLDGLKVYPSDYFSPMVRYDGTADVTQNTISIHFGAGTWTTEQEKRGVRKRRKVYSAFGRRGLRIYDGWILLRTKGFAAFFLRCKEIFQSHQ